MQNDAEAAVAVQLANHLQEKEMDYKIITPYDGQRNKILNDMKTEGLSWEDKCFNVDSFQGQLISLYLSYSNIVLQEMKKITL